MGAKIPLNSTSKVNTHTDKQTDIWTFRLIESIGPEGRCFENLITRNRVEEGSNPLDELDDVAPMKYILFVLTPPFCNIHPFTSPFAEMLSFLKKHFVG